MTPSVWWREAGKIKPSQRLHKENIVLCDYPEKISILIVSAVLKLVTGPYAMLERSENLSKPESASNLRSLLIVVCMLALPACGIGSATDEEASANTGGATTEQQNSAPTANAGEDQVVNVGTEVTLNGSGSVDPDGDSLSYAWSLESQPTGSQASLSAASASTTTFTADIAGKYVVQLEVSDGTATSEPDPVTVTAESANAAPIANAGEDQNVVTGATVILDGSASSDADGDLITYSWTLSATPQDSVATLSDSNVVNPTFVADLDGSYLVDLVVADSEEQSETNTVTIVAETANSTPVANAGADQNVQTNSLVVLDGSASSDADNDGLTYRWTIDNFPEGSGAQLDDDSAISPSFTADMAGAYSISLVVNDGIEDSAPDSVMVVAASVNSAPVADAGQDQEVLVGDEVTLDGSPSSDADGDELVYTWVFSSIPEDSTSILSDADAQVAIFSADKQGVYVVKLTVDDGELTSEPDTVSVTAVNSEPGLRLYETDAAFGDEELSWPYSSSRRVTVFTEQSECTLASFRLRAVGQSFTIANVSSTSFSTARVSFSGLEESQLISAGESLSFSLISSLTTGTVTMDYSFEVVETGDTFLVSGYVRCSRQ